MSDTGGTRKALFPQQSSFENCFEQLSRDSLLFGFSPSITSSGTLLH